MIRKLQLLLLLLATFRCGFAHAQSFEILDGNLRVTSLDGLWRFHTGDDPAWAKPDFDDSKWPLLRSNKDWNQQGYNGYSGMAWYRFQVTVPARLNQVSLLLPAIRTCYEVYADGQLIGSFGKMPPNKAPYGGGGRQTYKLPAGGHSGGQIEIALRVWQFSDWAAYAGGGPASGGGLVGDTRQIESRRSALQAQVFWHGSFVEVLALLQTLAGLGAIALFLLRRKEPEYLWLGLAMLFYAADNWLQVSLISVVWNLYLRDAVEIIFLTGGWLAIPIFYLKLLKPGRSRLLNISIALLVANLVIALFADFAGTTQHPWLLNLIGALSGLPMSVWILKVLISKAREGSHDARLLLLPQLPYTILFLIADIAQVTGQLGWQSSFSGYIPLTSTPFPISLQQAADALFPIALLAILVLRFSRTRGEEERYASEFASARSVQQFLIPDHLPATPGLVIDSVYRPAREVGGDFFQVLPSATDGSVLIVVGDVAGHGLKSGMLATLIVGALRTAHEFTAEPGRILSLLNKRMEGRGLATCLALRIERDGNIVLANAGHLPPYLNGRELAMEGALPLGAIPGIDFPVLRFKLAESDTLMLMTDGVAEAQNAAGQLFGFDRIDEMLRKGVAASALATAAQEFGQEDDITVLTLSFAGVLAPA